MVLLVVMYLVLYTFEHEHPKTVFAVFAVFDWIASIVRGTRGK